MTKFRQKITLHPTTMRIFDLANSRPLCHPFQKGGAVVSQLVPPKCHLFQKGGALLSHLLPGPCEALVSHLLPGPSVTCFKKVERLCCTFFQVPLSPVSKRWSARLAPSLQEPLVLHCKLPSSAFRLLAGFTCWDGGQGRARGFGADGSV
jgi:hypothetical protein